MSLSLSFNHIKFTKTNSLVKNNKTFLLLTFASVEANRFTNLRKVLLHLNAKLHFVKTNHINFALINLFPQVSSHVKGPCLLITIPTFDFEVLKRLSYFASANSLIVLTSVRDGLLQSNTDLSLYAKFANSNSVKLALLNCLVSHLNRLTKLLRTPFCKLILSFPSRTQLNQC